MPSAALLQPDMPGPIRLDGSENDAALSKSEFLTRPEVVTRRARRARQLARIYRDHYWALMEELKLKYREYYWEYGKSPYVEDEDNTNNNNNSIRDFGGVEINNNNNNNGGVNNGNRCGVHGCKAKAMALTRFCHMHILSDSKQKLYKACNFSIKSSITGPILCGKPILRSTVPSYCPLHFQKAEKHMLRSVKKTGHTLSSTNKLCPKFRVMLPDYIREILKRRKARPKGSIDVKEDYNS